MLATCMLCAHGSQGLPACLPAHLERAGELLVLVDVDLEHPHLVTQLLRHLRCDRSSSIDGGGVLGDAWGRGEGVK